MKTRLLIVTAVVVVSALSLGGCGRPAVESASAAEPEIVGPQYSAKDGLLVPEETRQSLGLKIVEVTEQKVPTTIELQLRVYEAGTKVSLASATIAPEQAKLIKPGQSLAVDLEGTHVMGRVLRVDGQLRTATGMGELLAEIPHVGKPPVIGRFLSARATLESTENVVTIPASALLQSSDGHSVYTVSGEHFVRTMVKVGASNESVVEIKDGLYAGDQVVSQPVMSLWLTELAAVKGGQACCIVPPKGK